MRQTQQCGGGQTTDTRLSGEPSLKAAGRGLELGFNTFIVISGEL